jgi:hypothetical protein
MNSSKAIKAKTPIVQIGLGNSNKPNESRRSSLVSIGGEHLTHEDAQDPNVFTLDLNELSGEKMENG